jgi:gas vesicle protein
MAKNLTNILIVAAAGIAAGVVLGLLFAPDKGSETRKKVRKILDDAADNFGETIEEKIDSVREAFGKAEASAAKDPGDGIPGK